jgi:hypothetical protein
MSSVSFTNILRIALTIVGPKSPNDTDDRLLAHFGSAPVKAAHKTLMKLTPESFLGWLLPGVMLDSFHRSCLRSSAGSVISGTSLWWTKLMQGGTCEKRDRRSGWIVVRTTGPPIHCCPDPDLNSVSPRLKASKFSPTSEGVFEPTDEQVEMLVETLTVLWNLKSKKKMKI